MSAAWLLGGLVHCRYQDGVRHAPLVSEPLPAPTKAAGPSGICLPICYAQTKAWSTKCLWTERCKDCKECAGAGLLHGQTWADTAALTIAQAYVCNVSQLPEAHAADHPALDHLEDLLLPNGTHLLVYGTSHVRSVRQVLTSVARYFKYRVTSKLLSFSDDCDTSADGSPEEETSTCGIMGEACLMGAGLQREEIEGGGGHAIITSVTNIAQYQLPEHADKLEKLIAEADPPFTHAYYQDAHTPPYFEAQCVKATTGEWPDPTKVGDGAPREASWCNIATPACQASTAQFAPFAKWLPQTGVRGGISLLNHHKSPKSAVARVFDRYKHFVHGHGGDKFTPDGDPLSGDKGYSPFDPAHACNIICAGAGTEEQACAPAEGLALAWEVLRSAGLRQCFKGWKGCDPL